MGGRFLFVWGVLCEKGGGLAGENGREGRRVERGEGLLKRLESTLGGSRRGGIRGVGGVMDAVERARIGGQVMAGRARTSECQL